MIPAPPDKPVRPEAREVQQRSLRLALQPWTWSAEQAQETTQRYTELARTWDGERGGYRSVPLADALARGGPLPPGLCLEVGSGTGLLTPLLTPIWPRVACLDLTWAMLRRSPAPATVLADAARLPVADGPAVAVILADVPLFAAEVVRVLAGDGVVVWSNALGADAPHHVPIEVVLSTLEAADPGRSWSAVTARAGWGLWAVLRRSG